MEEITDQLVPAYFTRALDEIYSLRNALAYEGSGIQQLLAFKTFPASRRKYAESQVERMFLAARGQFVAAYAGTSSLSLDSSMRNADASSAHLSVESWASERPAPNATAAVGTRENLDRAVREISVLRRGLAYEASVLLVHQGYPTFPKSRLNVTTERIVRMRAAARGASYDTYSGLASADLRAAFAAADATSMLTTFQWLKERQKTAPQPHDGFVVN